MIKDEEYMFQPDEIISLKDLIEKNYKMQLKIKELDKKINKLSKLFIEGIDA